MDQKYMVFDVESVGLHGEGFAVGWVVIGRDGRQIAAATYYCSPDRAQGDEDGRTWVAENVKLSGVGRKEHPQQVRHEFWEAWLYARERRALLFAECAWPVEARFLAACIDDDPAQRSWDGPYPLHDVATLRLAAGFDPLATVERLSNELPIHDPLADARQSARLLIEALNRVNSPSCG